MSVSVNLKKDDLHCLELLAKKNGKTVAHYISEAVEKYLENIEDEYLYKLAEERSKDTRPTIPFEEVRKEFGL